MTGSWTSDERCYGPPFAERYSGRTLSEAWEDYPDADVIEEWSVHDPIVHLPCAEWILRDVPEWAGENGEIDEYLFEDIEEAIATDAVIAAAEALRRAIADACTCNRMVAEVVARHRRDQGGDAGASSASTAEVGQ